MSRFSSHCGFSSAVAGSLIEPATGGCGWGAITDYTNARICVERMNVEQYVSRNTDIISEIVEPWGCAATYVDCGCDRSG
jgi:hypothetical protein